MDRPIRPFYCVYLLRSTRRRASLYIGSTPNPRRRLKQHNGVSTGGANRTKRNNLQPWDMVVTVTGFPSKTAALQFEWAWQHPHVTRHFSQEERINVFTDTKITKRGVQKRRLTKPAQSIQANMVNLYSLLSVDSFNRWPLNVRFFAKDVFDVWQKWTTTESRTMRDGIGIHLDNVALEEQSELSKAANEPPSARGIEALEVTYKLIRPHLVKSTTLLKSQPHFECVSCHGDLSTSADLILVCTTEKCNMTAHISCLADRFLREEGAETAILPIRGLCPSCHSPLSWSDLMMDLSLRTRGQEAIQTLLKDPKRKRSNKEDATLLAPVSEMLLDNNPDSRDIDFVDIVSDEADHDEAVDEFDDEDDDEFESISDVLGENTSEDEESFPGDRSEGSELSTMKRQHADLSIKASSHGARQARLVISDSECDDIDDISD